MFVVERVGGVHVSKVDSLELGFVFFVLSIVAETFFGVISVFEDALVVFSGLSLESGELTAASSDFTSSVATEFGGVCGAAEFSHIEVFLGIGGGADVAVLELLTEFTTVLPVARFGTEVLSATESGAFGSEGASSTDGFLSEFVDGGADLAWESAGHFEERPCGEERDDFDGDAEDEREAVFGGGDDSPADEGAGAEEDGEARVENQHLSEGFFPFIEPAFGVW